MNIKPLSIRTILLLTISTLTLLISGLVIRETYIEGVRMFNIRALHRATLTSDNLFESIDRLTALRDITYFIAYTPSQQDIEEKMPEIIQKRNEAEKSLENVIISLKLSNLSSIKNGIRETEIELVKLKKIREQVDKEIRLPLPQRNHKVMELWFTQITNLIMKTQLMWMELLRNFYTIDPTVTLHMNFKYILGVIMELSGRERSLISRIMIENSVPTPTEQASLLKWQGAIETEWDRINSISDQSSLSASVDPYLKDAKSHYLTVYEMVRDMFYIPGIKHIKTYPISVGLWFEVSSQTNDSIYALKNAALKETRVFVDNLESQARKNIIIHLIILCFSLWLCFYSFLVIISRVLYPINQMVNELINATRGNKVILTSPDTSRDDEIGKLTRVLYAFQKNMAEIKETSAKLERYTMELERSNKELDDFAYIASHDLKEPLRGIHNHSRFLLEDNKDKLDKDSVHRLDRLLYLSKRMERLVNDLLYFSRLGRQELAIQPTDINEVIHDIENTLDVFMARNNAKIIIPEPLPTIICDKVRIAEVFRNLITNAVKYNDKESKIIEIGFLDKCKLSSSEIIKHVFYVKDNGVGIAEEFHEEIFRIFKRLQVPKEPEEEGTGVGLTFIKKIIERHGGKIWLDSELTKGTIFYFTLEGQNNATTNNK